MNEAQRLREQIEHLERLAAATTNRHEKAAANEARKVARRKLQAILDAQPAPRSAESPRVTPEDVEEGVELVGSIVTVAFRAGTTALASFAAGFAAGLREPKPKKKRRRKELRR